MAEKYNAWSPYTYTLNNPVKYIDSDGKEPIKPLAGLVSNFIKVFNNTRTKMGTLKGTSAHNAMMRLGNVDWTMKGPKPATTGPFNQRKGRYIYTEKGGWIDMSHFMFYAGRAYQNKQNGSKNPIGESVQEGYKQEYFDQFGSTYSAYSYEDLPSDKFGADFAVNHFNSESDLTFGEQLQNYLNNQLGATTPESSPNYKSLPNAHPTEGYPSRQNYTTDPVYIEGDNGTKGAKQTQSGTWETTCFVAGTKVLMADGSSKNIEDVKQGDRIISLNMTSMALEEDLVLELPSKIKKYRLIKMSIDDGNIIEFSPAHPFWVVGKGWSVYDQEEAKTELTFEVNKINTGDTLLKNVNGKLVEVIVKSLEETGEVVEMYNVEHVAKNNNFFANWILVHNKRLNQN